MNTKNKLIYLIFIIIIIFSNCVNENDSLTAFERTEKYYGKQIEHYAKQYNISPSYLKALVILECSGKQKIKPRFEQGIYDKLILVKNKNLETFEDITYELIKNTPDSVIRNMATSWGSLQIMGYKCVSLGVDVEILKGKSNMAYAVKWVNETYGKYLKQGKYKDAFHIHNAGKPYPADGKTFTTDPNYVKNGIKYMKYFKRKNNPQNKASLKTKEIFQKKRSR